MSISVFDLFKIGIGPSSSHTVGPMVAARQFVLDFISERNIEVIDKIRGEFFGSLGATGKGHGTFKAVILGFEGDTPDKVDVATIDCRIENIKECQTIQLLAKHKIKFNYEEDLIFHRKKSLAHHANGMSFRAYDSEGQCLLEKQYYSIGGGFIVDDNDIENDQSKIHAQNRSRYSFTTGDQLLALCKTHDLSIADIILANERTWHSDEETFKKLDELWQVMQSCVQTGCSREGLLPGGLKVERRAKKLLGRLSTPPLQGSKSDPLAALDWVTLYALAVNEENASGGRVVTAPTNGAAGIIPAVLHYYINFIDSADDQGVYTFLLTAAAICILFKENASISGAEVGCQGEVGSACSMAAAGLTAVMGGTPEQIEHAAEIAMEHHLGLTCDPVGGLVQVPCIERNAVASVNAIHASRMALAGEGAHIVSLDKVIKTMRDTGRDMLEKYKETSRGGLAVNVVAVPVNIIEC